MVSPDTITEVLIRLTILLAAGWAGLNWAARRNPRWSVAVTRWMIVACAGLPILHACLPSTSLAVIPQGIAETTTEETTEIHQPQSHHRKNMPSEATTERALKPQEIETREIVFNEAAGTSSSIRPSPMRPAKITVSASVQETAPEATEFDHAALPTANSVSSPQTRDITTGELMTESTPASPNSFASLDTGFWWLRMCWLAGTGCLILRVCVQLIRMRSLTRASRMVTSTLQSECQEVAVELGLRHTPPVRLSERIDGPCTAGLFRAVVLVPDSWRLTTSPQERQAVLLHELSHVVGRDLLWNVLARLMTALWWFHPLTWRLSERHRLACEHTCDAVAAGSSGGFDEYRRMLAQWGLHRHRTESLAATLAMADRSLLLRRLRWLEVPRSPEAIGRAQRSLFVTIAVILLSGVASINLTSPANAEPPVREQSDDAQAEANQSGGTGKSARGSRQDIEKQDDNSKVGAASEDVQKTNANAEPSSKADADTTGRVRRPNVADIDLSRTTAKIVRVVDENERPIVGARVSIGWWEDEDRDMLGIGSSPSVGSSDQPKTNDKGEVTIDVPAGAVRAQISAVADGFAKSGTQYSLNGNPMLILQRGRVVRVRVVDADGTARPEAHPLLQNSRIFGREFKADPERPGYFTSPVVKPDRRWMRVADGSQDGPVLFSELIDVTKPQNIEDEGTIVATLKPGIRLEGRLDDSVPRPIGSGCVELYINEAVGHRIQRGVAWTWQDTAIVQEDGSFVFESLPAGGHVQLFALVDGYQSARPTADSLRLYLESHDSGDVALVDHADDRRDAFWPHLFPLPADQEVVQVELPCVPTASLDVRVVDPLGQPVEGAAVSFNPNGYFLGGELFIPATEGFATAALIRPHTHQKWKSLRDWANSTFLSPTTDASGVAHVRNLPADKRESYRVEAKGFVMPIHPTSSLPGRASRYAVVETVGGETLRRTITMEQFVPRSSREILVVLRDGKPVKDISVTVSEIAFADAPDAWESWATQRFGPVASGKTDQDGIVRMNVPTQVQEQKVAQVRIVVAGRVGRDASLNQTRIAIPAAADGRVVALTVSEDSPREAYQLRAVHAEYLDPDSLLSDSPQDLLKQLVESPSLVILKKLLLAADFKAAVPLKFRLDRNLLHTSPREDRSPVVSLPTNNGDRVVVLCDVRPQDAEWDVKPELRFPPQAAFVFDPNGSLVTTIGGWAGAGGSYNNIMLTNLGGTDDYFIQTSAFEEHGPFEYIQRWYWLGQELRPAITIHGYANATSWSGRNQPGTPLAEFGYLQLGFNGGKIDHKLPGTLPNGSLAARNVFWDGGSNKFIGPVSQSFDRKPLYRVVTGQSALFEPLTVKLDDIVVGGGRRDYDNWHQWLAIVPADKSGRLRLFLLDESGHDPKETELAAADLTSGQHNLQLNISDIKEDEQKSSVKLLIDAASVKEQPVLSIPRVPISAAASVKDQLVARTAVKSIDLLRRSTTRKDVWLIWRLSTQ